MLHGLKKFKLWENKRLSIRFVEQLSVSSFIFFIPIREYSTLTTYCFLLSNPTLFSNIKKGGVSDGTYQWFYLIIVQKSNKLS